MIPPLIIQSALDLGIDLLAITDHNSTANISAVQEAAAESGIVVLPGMELQTKEEVHMLCLFDSLAQVLSFQQIIDPLLPPIQNDPDHFGEQFIVDSTGDYIRSEKRLLLASANISLDNAAAEVKRLGGMAIPAHIDRKAYGLLSMLGFVPPEIEFDALEISRFTTAINLSEIYPSLAKYPMIQSGDVHRLDEFLGNCYFTMMSPDIQNLVSSFRGNNSCSFRLGV
jgi:3',5'-nucleoside bisphosphate phosphatase